jgi:hypothetical protein
MTATDADVRDRLARLEVENAALRAQQAATADVLRIISRAPTELKRVLDTVAESAARLCVADDAVIYRTAGDMAVLVTAYGSLPTPPLGHTIPLTAGSTVGRAIRQQSSVQVEDAWTITQAAFPERFRLA